MYNIKLTIEYDGTNFFGWQIQKSHISVQETIKNALEKLTQEKINLIGAGRTDAGVHAREQVANFKIKRKLPLSAFVEGLNSMLPPDIRIKKAEYVPQSFHARYSAKERIYKYFLFHKTKSIALYRQYYTCVHYDLSVEKMQKSAQMLIGSHDFSNFSIGKNEVKSSIRTINYIKIVKKGKLFIIEISANAFLRKMVRGIVGALIDIGRGFLEVEDMGRILSGNKKLPNFAPAKGLILWKVRYD